MAKYILKRLMTCLFVVFFSITAVFTVIRLVPDNLIDPKIPIEQQEQIKKSYGLDKPIHEQYITYLSGLSKFDLGKSIKLQKSVPVTTIISKKAAVSLQIGIFAIILSIFLGLLLGIIATIKQGKFLDHFTTILSVLGISIPSIVISILLQYFFTIRLGIFPAIYREGNFLSIVAPILALSFWPTATIARYIRNELIDVMHSEYILLAEAKGVKNSDVLFKHGLRNAAIPAITVVGPLFVSTLIGGLVVERVFAIPGLGGLMADAINGSDYPVIQGLTLVFSTLFTFTFLAIDIIYGIVDPRIRLAGGNK